MSPALSFGDQCIGPAPIGSGTGPDGLIRVTLGDDGRLRDAGNEAMRLSRSEFWATLDNFAPPQH